MRSNCSYIFFNNRNKYFIVKTLSPQLFFFFKMKQNAKQTGLIPSKQKDNVPDEISVAETIQTKLPK